MGGLGLIERENARILNASLLDFADRVANALVKSSEKLGLQCPVYVSQNDGTLIDLERVRQFPALTFASGPTNSIRGAWALTGLADAIVIDVGGTTSILVFSRTVSSSVQPCRCGVRVRTFACLTSLPLDWAVAV